MKADTVENRDAVVERIYMRTGEQLLFDSEVYNIEQLMELYAGVIAGVDTSTYEDNNLSAQEMAIIRAREQDKIGYEPTSEDIADLDAAFPMLESLKEITNHIDENSGIFTEMSVAVDDFFELSDAIIVDNLEEFFTVPIDVQIGEQKAVVTVKNKREKQYTYDTKRIGDYMLLKKEGLITLAVKVA